MEGIAVPVIVVALLAIISFRVLRSNAAINREKAELVAVNARLESTLKGLEEQISTVRQDKEATGVELARWRDQFQSLNAEKAGIESDLKNALAKAAEQDEWVKKSTVEFKAISSEVLEEQRKSFVETAIKPLTEKIETLDKSQVEGAASLKQQVESLASETRTLSSALSKPQVRGSWGEMQVERALELAGLQKGLHYTTQDSDQKGGRTDFIVHLSHGRDLILDSKIALTALQEAEEAKTDDEREEKLKNHAAQMRSHAHSLAAKEYCNSLPKTPDFVIMAVPDFALPPAAERDPTLIEEFLEKKVVIAAYSMLVPLLKCVALGWRQREVEKNVDDIQRLGREMHERLIKFADHLKLVGASLDKAVSAYNRGVGSFDDRLLPQARRFPELGVNAGREVPDLKQIDQEVRRLKE